VYDSVTFVSRANHFTIDCVGSTSASVGRDRLVRRHPRNLFGPTEHSDCEALVTAMRCNLVEPPEARLRLN
jgi:hypothetical protein